MSFKKWFLRLLSCCFCFHSLPLSVSISFQCRFSRLVVAVGNISFSRYTLTRFTLNFLNTSFQISFCFGSTPLSIGRAPLRRFTFGYLRKQTFLCSGIAILISRPCGNSLYRLFIHRGHCGTPGYLLILAVIFFILTFVVLW